MNRILYRIMGSIIAIAVFCYLGYQIYTNILTPYRTETAYVYVQSDYVAADGVAIRDELVLTAEQDGVLSYLHDDGDKVSLSMPVAKVYQSEQDAANQTAIKKLENEIEQLEQAADPGRADYINAEVLSGQISDRLSRLSYAISTRNLSDLESTKIDYLMLLNTRQIATARAQNFDARLSALKSEVESLKSTTQPALCTVTAIKPGYFVSTTDGYEKTLTTADAANLTVSQLEQIIASKPAFNADRSTAGKIITSFEWYYTALVPSQSASRFYKGLSVSVTFPYISDTAYSAVVTAVNTEEGSDYAVVTLRFNNMNAQVCSMREQKAEISFASYRGLKVRSDALRFQDGEPGVYVVNAAGTRFKKLDIIFYGDGFVISRQHTEPEYLALYDEMVIEGRDLAVQD